MAKEKEKNLNVDADKTTNLSCELLAMLKRAEKMIDEAKGEELKHMVNWGSYLGFAVNNAYSTESDYMTCSRNSFDSKTRDEFDLKRLKLEKELDFKRTEMEKDKDFVQAKMENGKDRAKARKKRAKKKEKDKEEKLK